LIINYLILAHHLPYQLKKLVDRLDAEEVYIYIHLDSKSDLKEFKSILNNSKVVFLEKRANAIWGNFTLVQATLYGMHKIIEDGRGGFTILLSGQDYPLAKHQEIKQFLDKHATTNFIDLKTVQEAWPHEHKAKINQYYLNLTPKRGNGIFIPYFLEISLTTLLKTSYRIMKSGMKQRNLLLCFQIVKFFKKRSSPIPNHYGGSQWWAINTTTLKMIVTFIEDNPRYYHFHKYTYIPDEIFFHTIIKLLAEKNPEMNLAPSLTYVNWKKHDDAFPAIFGIDDFDELVEAKKNGKFFARKFECLQDDSLFECMDKQL
jgi:hypothetical protein